MSIKKHSILKLAGLTLAASMAACGGGSDKAEPIAAAPAPVPVPLSGNATGVFTDGPVEGLAFSASPSGLKGSTNAKGEFSYAAGDTVSFTLGALSLGSVPAAATVTPIELAAGNADKLKNLLVLLQSLDSDGKPDNGITIPTKAAEAVTSAVDLRQAAATFASSANAGLTAAMTAGGISRAIVGNAAAEGYFQTQFIRRLSQHIWTDKWEDAGGWGVDVLRLASSGEYVLLQVGRENGVDRAGFEHGIVSASSVDARGFGLAVTIDIDSTGVQGLSTWSSTDRLRFDGDKLLFSELRSDATEQASPMSTAENDLKGLVGVWAFQSDSLIKTPTFVFWANGKYAMIDPVGDDGPHKCGGPGIEYGDYSFDKATNVFKVKSVSHDTNGCAGLNEPSKGAAGMASFTFKLNADGNSASFVFSDASYTLYRVSN